MAVPHGKFEKRMVAFEFRCFPKRIEIPVALRDQPFDTCQTSARLAHVLHRSAGTEASFSIPKSVCKLQFDELPITRRLAGVVRSIGARTLGDLNGLSACELLQCKNCYWHTVAEIEQLIERAIAGEFDAKR